jgi:hypothetical protein
MNREIMGYVAKKKKEKRIVLLLPLPVERNVAIQRLDGGFHAIIHH